VLFPVGFERFLELELTAEAQQQPVVPLFAGEVLSQSGEIKKRDGTIVVPKTLGGSDHERALAHLPGGQDITEFAGHEASEQVVVGLAPEVAGVIHAERAAGYVET
jgi:hypothetical protein